MKVLRDILYAITNSLLIPIIICLLLLAVWTLMLLGGFLREALDRGKVRKQLDSLVAAARVGPQSIDDSFRQMSHSASGILSRWLKFVGQELGNTQVLNHGLAQLESDTADSVARLTFITRVSPMVGLMGTLIPLGPALSGLANGNLQMLAGGLIVAFTATVVGLLVSAVAYGIGLTRRSWYARDLCDLEFVIKQLERDNTRELEFSGAEVFREN